MAKLLVKHAKNDRMVLRLVMGETLFNWVAHYGYIMIFSLLMVGILGLPVPDETLVTFAGYLSSRGELRLMPALVAAFLGTACGITLSYIIGRAGGFYLLRKYGGYIHLTEEKMARVRVWFGRFGKWVLFFGYFLPGVRHITALTAGASRLQFGVFALFAYAGGLAWTVSFLMVGYSFGEEWRRMSGQIRSGFMFASAAFIVLVGGYFLTKWTRSRKRGK
jgi:membrane protein DedA with SNARE-associated domain